ncbi:MAG: SCO family protein [Gammaproteobacteria bacterium]|nr:SCO family protein [Gammaproteobacteria bacterium]
MPVPAKSPWIVLLAVTALAGGIVVARFLAPAEQTALEPVNATWLRAPRPLPEFELLSHSGQAFRKENLAGNWSILFFGFTHCPDICPTTLATLSRVVGGIADQGKRQPRVIFVSVDPMRDSVNQLAAYVPYFNPEFIGLTGELARIQDLTRELGVAVHYSPTRQAAPGSEGEQQDYTVDHSTTLFLVDPDGRLSGIFSAPHVTEQIIDDYLIISGQT